MAQTEKFKRIDPQEAHRLLSSSEKVQLVDVREEDEYQYCHLSGAILCPLSGFPESFTSKKINPKDKILLYCHHGIRSARVASLLSAEKKYTQLYSLEGGIEAWSQQVDPRIPRY